MDRKFDLLGLFQTLYRWRTYIIGLCIAAGLGSIVVTLLMPNYYRASTTFLAASPDQSKPEILFGGGNIESEYYGNKNDIDRLLTLAESKELVQFLVDSFNLYEHYDIARDAVRAEYKVERRFSKYYEVLKTKRDAIQIRFEATSPELAAKLVNTARDYIDLLGQRLIRNTQEKALEAYQYNLARNSERMRELSDSLMLYRQRYGIFSINAQLEALTTQLSETKNKLTRSKARLEILESAPGIEPDTVAYVRAEVAGLDRAVEDLKEELNTFNQGLALVETLDNEYKQTQRNITYDQERMKRWTATKTTRTPAILLIEEAQVPEVKSRPRRSIIVLVSVAVAFLLAVIGVLLVELSRDINWKAVVHGE